MIGAEPHISVRSEVYDQFASEDGLLQAAALKQVGVMKTKLWMIGRFC